MLLVGPRSLSHGVSKGNWGDRRKHIELSEFLTTKAGDRALSQLSNKQYELLWVDVPSSRSLETRSDPRGDAFWARTREALEAAQAAQIHTRTEFILASLTADPGLLHPVMRGVRRGPS